MSDTETTHAPYECEYCETPHPSVSALLACEIICANDRGRE